jgi:hypothetical protein
MPMKYRAPASFLLPLSLMAFALTACISSHDTTYTDVERTKVTFATDNAGRIFYETLSRTPDSRKHSEQHTEVNLILINTDHRIVSGPNQLFNEAVAFCDTNHDGEVTEAEARIFADAWPRLRD